MSAMASELANLLQAGSGASGWAAPGLSCKANRPEITFRVPLAHIPKVPQGDGAPFVSRCFKVPKGERLVFTGALVASQGRFAQLWHELTKSWMHHGS